MGDMIRLLLMDEIQLTCNILAAVLGDEPDITVVACATGEDDALARVKDCDVVLVSAVALSSGRDVVDLVRAMRETAPETKILMLGLAESEEQILPYVQAGAFGYVLPDDSVEDLLARIRIAYQNKALVSPDIAAALITRINELAQSTVPSLRGDDGARDLTPREHEILGLIERGFTNQEIAGELTIEVGTVKNHVHNILQKLDVSSREDAAAMAALMAEGRGYSGEARAALG
jgi:two-component system nitrate/nitrite response regulator NarL